MQEVVARYEVTLDEARSSLGDYGAVLWTHGMFSPKDEGIRVIASSLGVSVDKIGVAEASAVQKLLSGQEPPESLLGLLPRDGSRLLVVCMAGGTSLQVAQILTKKGIRTESLVGGISALSAVQGRQIPDLVQLARG
jgi:rhodanese-related sulfurtransferase